MIASLWLGLAYGAGLADNLEAGISLDASVVDIGVKGSGFPFGGQISLGLPIELSRRGAMGQATPLLRVALHKIPLNAATSNYGEIMLGSKFSGVISHGRPIKQGKKVRKKNRKKGRDKFNSLWDAGVEVDFGVGADTVDATLALASFHDVRPVGQLGAFLEYHTPDFGVGLHVEQAMFLAAGDRGNLGWVNIGLQVTIPFGKIPSSVLNEGRNRIPR
jgi:hypothetical protein